MTLHEPVVALHVAVGSLGLLLGPLAMHATKRRGPHTRLGEAYHWTMLAVCLSAAALAALAWSRLWWFLPIAAFSYANALVGYVAAKRRRRGWIRSHVGGMLGSYIALVTALLVVNIGDRLPLVWFLPTLLGSPLIAWLIREIDRGRRPRGRPPRRAEPGLAAADALRDPASSF